MGQKGRGWEVRKQCSPEFLTGLDDMTCRARGAGEMVLSAVRCNGMTERFEVGERSGSRCAWGSPGLAVARPGCGEGEREGRDGSSDGCLVLERIGGTGGARDGGFRNR
jgi:hypothetical protein